MWSQLLTQILPALVDALTPMLVAAIAALIYRWTGVQIEQKHMIALQSALQNGARLMLSPDATLDDAIDYVEKSVPDALRAFNARDRPRIAELLEPHIAAVVRPSHAQAELDRNLKAFKERYFFGADGEANRP